MSARKISRKYSVTLIRVTETAPATYSLEAAARLAGVRPDILRKYCRLGLFGEARARQETDPIFDDDALYELRRFEHYRRNYGMNRRSLRLVCSLWREVDRLEAELRLLRGL